jgi:hypothetical protein
MIQSRVQITEPKPHISDTTSSSNATQTLLQVEDSRRVTQEALVIVDDSWMNIHDDLFILSYRK